MTHAANGRDRLPIGRREVLAGGAAMAAILATGRAPVFAQVQPVKLVYAHINAPPDSGATAFQWMAEEAGKRSNGALQIEFHGGTLLSKELDIANAVKSGNIAMGSPSGAAATIFPEMGVFLVPYLVRDYEHAYAMFNGRIGQDLDEEFQKKYKIKVLTFFDYGFRHFWNSKRPIVEPKDLRGLKMRVQQAKVFGDTINGLGGNAVPMPWGEVVPAAQQKVIDGGDLPVVNVYALKVYEVTKYLSMTYHNYGPTLVMFNLEAWTKLSPEHRKLLTDLGREAQGRVRQATESIDTLPKAKELLDPKGLECNAANTDAFRKVAQEKIWPNYKQQFGALWERIVEAKA